MKNVKLYVVTPRTLKELIAYLQDVILPKSGDVPVRFDLSMQYADNVALGEVLPFSRDECLVLELAYDVRMSFAKAPKPSKWRKVEDELPNDARPVMIYSTHREGICLGYWAPSCHQWHFHDKDTVHVPVTHWRELPKPPKDGE